jgi:hypothetical protein
MYEIILIAALVACIAMTLILASGWPTTKHGVSYGTEPARHFSSDD